MDKLNKGDSNPHDHVLGEEMVIYFNVETMILFPDQVVET